VLGLYPPPGLGLYPPPGDDGPVAGTLPDNRLGRLVAGPIGDCSIEIELAASSSS